MASNESKHKVLALSDNLRESLFQILREYAEALIIAISLALLLRFFVLSVYRIPTGTMAPTLKIGDFILAVKLPYSFSAIRSSQGSSFLPERGDVMVFRCPQKPSLSCVKRVVGLPGDRVQLVKKRLVVNEKVAQYTQGGEDLVADLPGHQYYAVVNENWEGHIRPILISQTAQSEDFGPVIVPPGHVFVLGDNRDSSDDSRYWGSVPLKSLEGKVFLVWLSLDWRQPSLGGRLPSVRWERVMQRVH